MRVAYTDPSWALDENGDVDRSAADIEASVYGDDIAVELGVRADGRFLTEGRALADYVRGADAVVVSRCVVTPELLEAVGPACRVVARQGVGLDNLNADLLRDSGIFGFHVPDYCGDEVSTHTLALLLALERRVCVQDVLVKSGRWRIHGGGMPRRTCTLTAGIVGFGRIGRATSRKLQPIYREVIACDPNVSADLMASYGVGKCKLPELLARADAICVHAELLSETVDLVDAEALRHVRHGALLVNAARGRLVDPVAVRAALEDGALGGFASDVFSPEDPNDSEETRALLQRDDVVVSSHRGFLSVQSEISLRRRVAEGVAHVLRSGEPPPLGRVA
ncbi:MAG TPA: NAD(P)-dependent oxidoreductase [Conexibacter sp.]|nr:NAD(P)-dependent oxidoreductase [Conexibacter sp.]